METVRGCIHWHLCFPKRSSEFVYVLGRGPKYFWYQGPITWMTIFPQTRMGVRMVLGWFKCILFIVHFISNLMQLLIWQKVSVCGLEIGGPCVRRWAVMGRMGRDNYKLARSCRSLGQLRWMLWTSCPVLFSPEALGVQGIGTRKTNWGHWGRTGRLVGW